MIFYKMEQNSETSQLMQRIPLRTNYVQRLSMFVDMLVNILWGKFVKMTYLNDNLIKHWFLIIDFISLNNFELKLTLEFMY